MFLLDEGDKMSTDFRGDPSSALLEVLDPEQNKTFDDHYLDLEYDLSKILFITTANTLATIPRPLQDRMEIIQLPGYIEEEKLEIAKQFLVPKQIKEHGLEGQAIEFTDPGLYEMIRRYTKEAGVRSLEREIGAVCRKLAREVVANDGKTTATVGPKQVRKYLGVPKYRFGKREETDQVGIATGLAFTEVGGELLTIEALVTAGKGRVQVSGHLGDIMKESAQAALSYGAAPNARAGARLLPEGRSPRARAWAACPRTARRRAPCHRAVSALTGIPVREHRDDRRDHPARARAADRRPEGEADRGEARIETVLIPKENERDLKEIPAKVKRRLRPTTSRTWTRSCATLSPNQQTGFSDHMPQYALQEIDVAEVVRPT